MQHRKICDWKAWAPAALAGGAAGLVNGFFGGGGGMVLVPLLAGKCGLERRSAFASSVAIILPLCALSAVIYFARGQLELLTALPYLLGGLLGDIATLIVLLVAVFGGSSWIYLYSYLVYIGKMK